MHGNAAIPHPDDLALGDGAAGEKRYIFPYQENADVMFNSALVYELSALKPLAEPLLRQVPHGTLDFIEAKRLLAFLEWFLPIDTSFIPPIPSCVNSWVGRV